MPIFRRHDTNQQPESDQPSPSTYASPLNYPWPSQLIHHRPIRGSANATPTGPLANLAITSPGETSNMPAPHREESASTASVLEPRWSPTGPLNAQYSPQHHGPFMQGQSVPCAACFAASAAVPPPRTLCPRFSYGSSQASQGHKGPQMPNSDQASGGMQSHELAQRVEQLCAKMDAYQREAQRLMVELIGEVQTLRQQLVDLEPQNS